LRLYIEFYTSHVFIIELFPNTRNASEAKVSIKSFHTHVPTLVEKKRRYVDLTAWWRKSVSEVL